LSGVELARLQDMLQNILESYQDKAQDGLKGGKKKVRKDGGSKQRRSSESPLTFLLFICSYLQMLVLSFLYVFPSSRVREVNEFSCPLLILLFLCVDILALGVFKKV
jgi:hypothetical protein